MDQQPVTPQTPEPVAPVAPPVRTAAPLEPVPSTWPGAFGAYKYSKQATRLNLGVLVILYVLSFVTQFVLSLFKLPGVLISDLLSIYFVIAIYLVFMAGVRGEKLSVEAALKKAADLKLYVTMFAVLLLTTLAIGFGFVLFIIPGIIILPRLVLAPYFVIDKRLGIGDSIKTSWEATKGHSGMIWGTIGAAVAMLLLSVTIIGIPFSFYFLIMYSSVSALLYYYIIAHPKAAAATVAPQTPVQPAAPAPPAAV